MTLITCCPKCKKEVHIVSSRLPLDVVCACGHAFSINKNKKVMSGALGTNCQTILQGGLSGGGIFVRVI